MTVKTYSICYLYASVLTGQLNFLFSCSSKMDMILAFPDMFLILDWAKIDFFVNLVLLLFGITNL